MNIFIDTQDMEERYGEELYKEYLENQNKEMKEKIDKANEILSNILVIKRSDGNYGAVKNTRKQDVYKTVWKLYEILDTSSYERNEMLKILGDKENE